VRPERIVLDTNTLVSALINSFGAPGRVLDLVLSGEVVVAHDDRLFAEWRDVMYREKFGFDRRDVEIVLGFMESEGIGIKAPPLGANLPDPDDVPFLEVAHATGAALITGNMKHYPEEERRGVEVMGAAEFLEKWISEE
jgi:uncharacterized protein